MSDPTYPSGLTRRFLDVMGQHLPSSLAGLRVVDVEGRVGAELAKDHADVTIIPVSDQTDTWNLMPDSVDLCVAYDFGLSQSLLRTALAALRPGGRLVVVNPGGKATPVLVKLLEEVGYTGILVQPALEQPKVVGVLVRGEKPAPVAPPVKRPERYIHLLIRQEKVSSNKNMVEWYAAAVAGDDETVLLAFSSLVRATEFMEFAAESGYTLDIDRVAKFSWTVTKGWPEPFMLNPTDEILGTHMLVFVPVDPTTAEASDP
ncbi:MAG: hypothetical protein K8I60_06760 [Anaerolineae bacterium]|nr:hypothetical protein [Anaerolineae bacterium]